MNTKDKEGCENIKDAFEKYIYILLLAPSKC
jgi:hypothetical protein